MLVVSTAKAAPKWLGSVSFLGRWSQHAMHFNVSFLEVARILDFTAEWVKHFQHFKLSPFQL